MYQYCNEKPNKALDILYANRIPKPKKKITAYQEQKKKLEQQLFRINSRSTTTTRKLEQQQIKTLWQIKKIDEKKGGDLPNIQYSRSSNLPDHPRTRKKNRKRRKMSSGVGFDHPIFPIQALKVTFWS